MSRAEKEEGQYMIRTIERAKTHYDVFQLPDDADAKTIRTTMRDMLRKIHPRGQVRRRRPGGDEARQRGLRRPQGPGRAGRLRPRAQGARRAAQGQAGAQAEGEAESEETGRQAQGPRGVAEARRAGGRRRARAEAQARPQG